MSDKTCAACGERKPVEEFSLRAGKGRHKGTKVPHSWCKPCVRAYDKKRKGTGDKIGAPITNPVIDGKKRCPTCGVTKPVEDFAKDSKSRTGYQSRCKACAKAHHLKKMEDPEYRAKRSARALRWAQANPERASVTKRRWDEQNPEKKVAIQKRARRKFLSNQSNKLGANFRTRAWIALKGCVQETKRGISEDSILALLGCSLDEWKTHLEAQFKPGMTWENWARDGWHIDHIVPLASFDLEDPEQAAVAFHYSNTQPLWASENLSKGATLPGE
jgi:hypothetical protein